MDDILRGRFPCGRQGPPVNSRREFLSRAGAGFGMLALGSLLNQDGLLAAEAEPVGGPLAAKPGHHPAKAKSEIWLFMKGAPSAMDTFDPKPEVDRHDGQRPKEAISTFFGNPGPLMKSPFTFKKYGQCGMDVGAGDFLFQPLDNLFAV